MQKKQCQCSRRKFLISSTKAALGAAVSAELLSSCNKKPANIIGDDEQKIATIDLDLYAKLKLIGGSEKIPDIEEFELIAYRKSEDEVVVLSELCTHQGVPVGLPDENGIIKCPQDGAEFDAKQNGKALSPAITPLDLKSYYSILDGNVLTIFRR